MGMTEQVLCFRKGFQNFPQKICFYKKNCSEIISALPLVLKQIFRFSVSKDDL